MDTPTNVAEAVAAYRDRLIDKGIEPHLADDLTRDLAHAVHHGHYPYPLTSG